jgi:hypothetical protein
MSSSEVTMSSCTLSSNAATDGGGAVMVSHSTGQLEMLAGCKLMSKLHHVKAYSCPDSDRRGCLTCALLCW